MPRAKNIQHARSSRRLRFEPLESRHLLTQMVHITEFMASNDTTLVDGDGRTSDWIEIHNASNAAIDLAGWHLTDDSSQLDKWTFPSGAQSILDAGEYLVLIASGAADPTYVDSLGYQHTNFRLSAGGEYLGLIDSALQIVDEFAPSFPQQQTDISYGINPDDLPAGAFFFAEPTPGAVNSIPAVTEAIQFSQNSGTFSGSILLTLSGTTSPDQSIVYTLDNSIPGPDATVYTQPILITQTTQVRTQIIEPGKAAGPVASASFSRLGIDVQNFESQLPIVLIENFGDGQIPSKDWNQTGAGIHQVARQPSTITVFESELGNSSLDGNTILHSRTGIRTRGAFSTTFPEPQYSVETWTESNDDLAVEVFGMAEESDWILYSPNPAFDQTLMNNQFMFGLAQETNLWTPEYQFVEAFVNTDGGDVTMDDYVGLYVWQEKVKRDEGRLDFDRFAEDGSSGGWLLAINRIDPIPFDDPTATPQFFHTPGPNGVLQTNPNQQGSGDDIPRQHNAHLNFEHPNGYDINSTQRQAIEDWFANMEDVLYGRTDTRWNDPVHGYAKYIDVDNFIDYYILHNLSKNGDGLLLSMWIYNPDPNNGGKLKFGPPWDHDLGAFEGNPETDTRYRANRLWFDRLFDDPAFEAKYESRWQNLRQGILSDDGINNVFDELVTEIGTEAVARDGVTNLTSRINTVKNWLARRADAIDESTGGAMNVQFVTDQNSGAPPLTVQFTDQSNVSGATDWFWDFGDGNTSTLLNPTHTYTTGIYDVTLTVTGNLGPITFTSPGSISAVLPGDVNLDGILDQADVTQFVAGWRSDTSELSELEKILSGDLNRDGTTNFSDWHLLRVAWIAQENAVQAGSSAAEEESEEESTTEAVDPVDELADSTAVVDRRRSVLRKRTARGRSIRRR